jgi:nucleoside-diphosphate-sugar epimerase
MMKNIFITGASGFGMGDVANRLANNGYKLSLLVRSQEAEDMAMSHISPESRHRVEFYRGDITEKNCGISPSEISTLANNIDIVLHGAANTSFSPSKKDVLERVNVLGTENVLSLAHLLHNRRKNEFFYVSTAYVAGKDEGVIPEAQLSLIREYSNDYERTKHIAESTVRQQRPDSIILRPSIMMADSQTLDAKCDKRMVYGFMWGVQMAADALMRKEGKGAFWDNWHKATDPSKFTEVNFRINADPRTPKDLITLDDFTNVTEAVLKDPMRYGRTYNIVNPMKTTVGQIIDTMQRALHITGVTYDPTLTRDQMNNAGEKMFDRAGKDYYPYVHGMESQWKSDNVRDLRVCRVPMTQRMLDSLLFTYANQYMLPKAK